MRAFRSGGAWGPTLAVASILASAAGAVAAEGRMVEFKGGMGQVGGYLATPEGEGPFPAIVVIQEWWGLTDWIKRNADHFAERGYVALAVDLYHGKVAQDMATARELATGLDHAEALADLKGAVDYLKARDDVADGKPLGVIGWCMGGGFARELAQESDAVGPTVICYGRVTDDAEAVAKLKDNPILGIFGGDDRGIPAEGVVRFAKAVNAAGGEADVHIYDRVGHAFMNPTNERGYAEKAAEAAWDRIDKFFAERLKSTGAKSKSAKAPQ